MYMFSRGLLAVAWREGLLPGPVYRSTMEPFAHIADIEGRRPAASGLPNHLGPKTGRFRPGQKRMSFVRRDRREESNVSDAAFTTNDCFDAPDAIRCKDRHHLRRAHADGESL